MYLHGEISIKYDGEVLTAAEMTNDSERWKGIATASGMGRGPQRDVEMLRAILHNIPFHISASEETILHAEVSRHPYSIDDDPGFYNYSFRLFPIRGAISSVFWDSDEDDVWIALNHIVFTPTKFYGNIGNGSKYFEIYLCCPTMKLSPLPPPRSFKDKRYTSGYRESL